MGLGRATRGLLGSGSLITKKDLKVILIIFFILVLLPLCFMSGFPFFFFDSKTNPFFTKSIPIFILENIFPLGLILFGSVCIFAIWKFVNGYS